MGKQITEKDRAKIEQILHLNKLDYEDISRKDDSIIVTIKNGDWKHSHLFLEFIMSEEGYYSNERVIIEDDNDDEESDSYSAKYIFKQK